MPSKKDIFKVIIANSLFFPLQKWCDAEANIPDQTKIIVFKRGIPKGLIASIPFGGHDTPISGEGLNITWKYAQKKDVKNIASLITKK